jgi:hypothetical protein
VVGQEIDNQQDLREHKVMRVLLEDKELKELKELKEAKVLKVLQVQREHKVL